MKKKKHEQSLRFFAVNSAISAETLLVRSLGLAYTSADWAKEATADSVSAGIIQGATTSTLAPRENAIRVQAAVMLKRMLQLLQFIN
ncbi:MAG: hypothetical protein A2189_03650 [Paenibacillus sp. RIFOXYA1_FULL_44_5]|nr:MAG: hypothetical protein A2189_03650 [Paenibacillus sp. RIFOXYA1_FULL_44_5]